MNQSKQNYCENEADSLEKDVEILIDAANFRVEQCLKSLFLSNIQRELLQVYFSLSGLTMTQSDFGKFSSQTLIMNLILNFY
ncbi:hypothetical protein TRFO_41716 [Tritrichomonas foetus]|uniref:Uncharacterized protein n=1 Tax=Tritrichomonas foetus TaxID=1144522 RepID=A0A1J4L3R2_9EUKA|nr:hypothetical protein TRFO_41716 [Tritrichomonas foetus]|eukprot:OHT16590.1 hypothetical protein TRFO_41716 [Tritrichomonas foetus]